MNANLTHVTGATRTPDDPVSTIMSAPVAEISGYASLAEVAEALAAAEVGALVVVDGGQPLGVVSERDVVRAIAEATEPPEPGIVWAADLACPETVWAAPTDSIRTVAELMRDAEIRHVPLRAGGVVVGMVSMRDVLAVLAEADTH